MSKQAESMPMNEPLLGAQNIIKKLEEIENLPTLPPIAMKVNALLRDNNTSVNIVSEAIEKDQVIASKILKLVNSAFFGLSSRIGNMPHALVLLGFNTVRNAVISVAIVDTFSEKIACQDFDVKQLWRHGIAVAVTSRHLAQKSRLQPPEDAFIGGLIHDLGKFVLFYYFADEFSRVWSKKTESGYSFYQAEMEVLGTSHEKIGGILAKKWKLPSSIISAILYHHRIESCKGDQNMPLLVHAADAIVNWWDTSDDKNKFTNDISPIAKKALTSSLDNVDSWYPETLNDIEDAYRLLLLEGNDE